MEEQFNFEDFVSLNEELIEDQLRVTSDECREACTNVALQIIEELEYAKNYHQFQQILETLKLRYQ